MFFVFFCPDITLEIFSKRLRGQEILPLLSQRDFVLLYSAPAPLPRFSLTRGRTQTPGGVQPRSTSKQNTTNTTNTTTTTNTPTITNTAPTITNTAPTITNTTAPNITKRRDPAAPRRRSLGSTDRVRTSRVSGNESEDVVGDPDTSNSSSRPPEPPPPSSTSRHVPAAGGPLPPTPEPTASRTPSTHVCGRPLKSSHSRVELRLNKCSWPPPSERHSAERKKKRSPKRANFALLPTTRELSEGGGGTQEETPGGAAPPQATPSPHRPGRPAQTGSQETGNETSEGGGSAAGCLTNGSRKGEERFRICR